MTAEDEFLLRLQGAAQLFLCWRAEIVKALDLRERFPDSRSAQANGGPWDDNHLREFYFIPQNLHHDFNDHRYWQPDTFEIRVLHFKGKRGPGEANLTPKNLIRAPLIKRNVKRFSTSDSLDKVFKYLGKCLS